MLFKDWVFNEDRKLLAKVYADLLKNTPQDPVHHSEGDVLIHTKLVRKAIPEAVKRLRMLKSTPQFSEVLGNIDFNLSDEELKILYMAAWLHDVGKATATTIGGVNYSFLRQMDILYQNDPSKIKSVGHEKSAHYSPLIKALGSSTPEDTKSFYLANKDTIEFIIDHHMSFRKGESFPRLFIDKYFDSGRLVSDRRVKLLLVFIWADKIGRLPQSVADSEKGLLDSSRKSIDRKEKELKSAARRASAPSDPLSMIRLLRSRVDSRGNKLTDEQIRSAVKGKFPDISDDVITKLIISSLL